MVVYVRVILGCMLAALAYCYSHVPMTMNDDQLAKWYASKDTGLVLSESLKNIFEQPHLKNLIGPQQIDCFVRKNPSDAWFSLAAVYSPSLIQKLSIQLSYPVLSICRQTTEQLLYFLLGHEIGHHVMNHNESKIKALIKSSLKSPGNKSHPINNSCYRFIEYATEFEADVYAALALGASSNCAKLWLITLVAQYLEKGFYCADDEKTQKISMVLQALFNESIKISPESIDSAIDDVYALLNKYYAKVKSYVDYFALEGISDKSFKEFIHRHDFLLNSHPSNTDRLLVLATLAEAFSNRATPDNLAFVSPRSKGTCIISFSKVPDGDQDVLRVSIQSTLDGVYLRTTVLTQSINAPIYSIQEQFV